MTAKITQLIHKQDTFEIVRDRVALILAEEQAQQQVLATAAGEDAEDYALRVFIERSNPWEFMQTNDGVQPDTVKPVVNVWFDSTSIEERASQTVDRQQYSATYNIDVFGASTTEVTVDGQVPGDRGAALAAQQAARLVRGILMSDSYVQLGFPKAEQVVGQRTITTITSFQPEYGNMNAVHVSGVRLSLQVRMSEHGPQTAGVTLEAIESVTTDEFGEVILDAEFVSTV